MVLTLAIPIRAIYGLEDFITVRHLENMAKVMLVTGLIVAYGYTVEAFVAWYSADTYEGFMIWNRMTGPYAPVYWSLIACNIVIPQALWFRRVRNHAKALFVVAIVVNIGMWLERSSSSSRACTVISCRPRGACTARRSGTGRRLSARSACS